MITNIKNFKKINESVNADNPSGCLPFGGINPEILKQAQEIAQYAKDLELSKPDTIGIVQKVFVDPSQAPDDISVDFVQNYMGMIVRLLECIPDSEYPENINTFDKDDTVYNDLPFERKSNKIMNIKTFEQFKLDNSNAQIKVQEYLQDILNTLKSMNYNDFKSLKSKYGNTYFMVGDWSVSGAPHTESENETTTEFNTEFTNDKEQITIIMNISVFVNFYEVWPETQTTPAEYDDNNTVDIESIAMYDNEGDEYFIKLTPEINKISNEIINNIINK